MKKYIITGLIFILMSGTFSCEKLKDPAGERNVAGVPAITDLNPGIFDSKDLVNSFVEFKLNLQSGFTAEKVVIIASYNNSNEWTDITEITNFPATVRLVSGNVIQQLGLAQGDIANGDVFTFQVEFTENGKNYFTNSVINVPVACAFDPALTKGSYHSVSAEWVTDGNVTITASPTDPYTIYVAGLETIDGNVEDLGPLVMHINPITYAVTAVKTTLVSTVSWGPYHNLAYAGTGVYNSCNGTYEMNFEITVTEGLFGTFGFTMTKN
jgi:hypothetical protein